MVKETKQQSKPTVKKSKSDFNSKVSKSITKEFVKEKLKDIDSIFNDAQSKIKLKKHSASLENDAVEDVSTDESDGGFEYLEDSQENSHTYGLIKSSYSNKMISPEAPLERIDKESGLPVYKAHLLKVGEGGGTELCPFDCDCCF
jgi:hypothetical protein